MAMTYQAPVEQGTLFTVAGTGVQAYSGDHGPATEAALYEPHGVVRDDGFAGAAGASGAAVEGVLYVADSVNRRVRRVDAHGVITTVAGTGDPGGSGDRGPAVEARLTKPTALALDRAGNLYIADTEDHRVRRVSPDGTITTVAGNGEPGSDGDGKDPAEARVGHPTGLAVDRAGALYIAHRDGSANSRVRKVTRPGGTIETLAGGGPRPDDGIPATEASLSFAEGIAVDDAGDLYIAQRDSYAGRVRKVAASDGTITTVAGQRDGGADFREGGIAVETRLNSPCAVVVDGAGDLLIADAGYDRVCRVTPDGLIHTVAGNGRRGYAGENVVARTTTLSMPYGLALDGDGNVYIGERGNNRVREVAGAVPPTPPPVDLRGVVCEPHFVWVGQEFELGVWVENCGSAPVDGGDITVTLTLADGLVPVAGGSSPLVRTFPGQPLLPHVGTLDGTFTVVAPEGTPEGVYRCTARIHYSGTPDFRDLVYPLAVKVSEPRHPDDETGLDIRQEGTTSAAPGHDSTIDVVCRASHDQPINPGRITLTFDAPTGFVFIDFPHEPTRRYLGGGPAEPLADHSFDRDGTRLVVRDEPHVNTVPSDSHPLLYSLPVRALPGAAGGTHADGLATFGKHPPVPLEATVTAGAANETALRVHRTSMPQVAAGRTADLEVEIRSLGDRPVNPGPLDLHFTAPTGFVFTGTAAYRYPEVGPKASGDLQGRIEDEGRTLVVTSTPHLNNGTTDQGALTYRLGIRALPDAAPGLRSDDGGLLIGRLAPVPLSARVEE
ncbi:hypothetical protein AB0H77_36945 [Streptomyces sp. NPDC050844]|uniref:hypothetical protein n=1 Tax=Streptomyces sp. NPDC050844 TaxID=3155790 RepID=UPI0033FC5F06